MKVLETPRLILRPLRADDAGFILELLNDPAWIQYIGDKGVHTLDEARDYLRRGPMDMVERLGFGLLLVSLRDGDVPAGICGLIQRAGLDDVDIGFAFLPAFRAQGLAREAAAAVLADGRDRLGLRRIVAITAPDNEASGRLLARLGFVSEGLVVLDRHDVHLLAWAA